MTQPKGDVSYLPQASSHMTEPAPPPPPSRIPHRSGSPLRPVVPAQTSVTASYDNAGLVDPEALQAMQPLADRLSANQQSRQAQVRAVPSSNIQQPRVDQKIPASNATPTRESVAPTLAMQSDAPRPQPADEQFRWNLGNYMLGRTIGAGSMGKVKYGYCKSDGQTVAVKIVPRNTSVNAIKQNRGKTKSGQPLTEAELELAMSRARSKDASKEVRVIREGSLQMLLVHPYVCRMREMITHPNHHYMVFEHIDGGQMLDYIIAHGRLRERAARTFARQIGSALQYCHANNVVHRDLKIENILISKSGNIKIIDFGLSNMFKPNGHLNTFCGSLYFAAPELLNARVYTGPEVDVWSFGVVLYVLVCGKVPFDDQSMPVLHARIKRGMVDYPSWLSSDCKHILSRMIDVNPSTRATLEEIMSHPWMMKDHNAPEPTYLPARTPLTARDLNLAVIERMTGFEFGSPQEITQQLQKVLSSEEYVAAVGHHFDSATAAAVAAAAQSVSQATTEQPLRGNRFSRQLSAGIHFYRHLSKSSTETSEPSIAEGAPGIKGPLHPTYGFHPLISIYFLVKEKMEREHMQQEVQNSSDVLLASSVPAPPAKPTINVPDSALQDHLDQISSSYSAAALASPTTAARFASDIPPTTLRPPEMTHASSRTISIVNPISVTPSPPPPIAAMMTPSQSEHKTPVFESRQKSQPQGIMLGPPRALAHADELESSLKAGAAISEAHGQLPQRPAMPQRSVSMMHARHAEQMKSRRDKHTSMAFSGAGARPLPTLDAIQSDVGMGLLPSVTEMSYSEAPEPTGSGASLSRRFGTMTMRPTHESSHASDTAELESHVHSKDLSSQSTGASATPEDAAKPVFLKGLFSVQTTSRRPRMLIRRDLIRVLEQFNVGYTETKGGFECVYSGPLMDADVHQSYSAASSKNALNAGVVDAIHDSNSLVATGVGEVTIERLPASDTIMPTPTLENTPPKARLNKPLPPNEEDEEVCFEIGIVKVPLLLGMNGLQFRRVSGNPWKYQTLAKRILNDLHL